MSASTVARVAVKTASAATSIVSISSGVPKARLAARRSSSNRERFNTRSRGRFLCHRHSVVFALLRLMVITCIIRTSVQKSLRRRNRPHRPLQGEHSLSAFWRVPTFVIPHVLARLATRCPPCVAFTHGHHVHHLNNAKRGCFTENTKRATRFSPQPLDARVSKRVALVRTYLSAHVSLSDLTCKLGHHDCKKLLQVFQTLNSAWNNSTEAFTTGSSASQHGDARK